MSDNPQALVAKDEFVLVAEAKAGSYAAFEELVSRYEKKIYRLGINLTGNPEDAEDVLQETFLKAFQHLPDFREDSRFYTWIVRIAVNQALMKLRRRKTDRSVSLDEAMQLNADEPEFGVWKAWCGFLVAQDKRRQHGPSAATIEAALN